MAATLERQIYEAIRGKCVSDASAEQAAALAAKLAVEKFTTHNSAMVEMPPDCPSCVLQSNCVAFYKDFVCLETLRRTLRQ